jgi:uncharacterized membrane protein
MWAGLPISLLSEPEYKRRAQRIRTAYGTIDAEEAWRIFKEARIQFVYVDGAERAAFRPEALAKFDLTPTRFTTVFRNGEVTIYRVN